MRSFQRPSSLNYTAPAAIAISQSDPNIIIVAITNGNEFWETEYDARSALIKSTNGGLNWLGEPAGFIQEIVKGGNGGTPNRSFNDVEFDPKDPNIVYMSVSGYYYPNTNEGHVFRSVNGGYNWESVNGNLPDIPVNDIMIHYTGPNAEDVELIAATDAGIYSAPILATTDWTWGELAGDFPNTIALHMDYNRLSGKLRANTFGRGAWELQLDGTTESPGPIYVQDKLYITDDVTINNQIVVCNGGEVLLGHSAINTPFTINFGNNSNIQVVYGGHLTAYGPSTVTLTSSSSWPGIEFLGNGSSGSVNYCTFTNTETPVTIEPQANDPVIGAPNNIGITHCNFNSGPITITNRGNVMIDNCNWNYSSGIASSVCGVSVNGAPGVTVQWSTINYTTSTSYAITGISAVQASGITISHNVITNAAIGIMASNCDPNIRFNKIESPNGSATIGIGLDQCSNPVLYMDTVIAYNTGISLDNGSSAVMHDNKVINSVTYGLKCDNSSSPRMTPTIDNGTIYWDAGLNILESSTNGGSGIWIGNYSTPNMADGYNTVWGGTCYISGSGYGKWSVINNCWVDATPVSGKFCQTGFQRFTYSPYSCTPPPGAGSKSSREDMKRGTEKEDPIEPPQPLIVDYGNGVIDTLKATTSNQKQPEDNILFNRATKKVLESNFKDAVNTYKQVVQNYPESEFAAVSLAKILYCFSRMNSNAAEYDELRNYFMTLGKGAKVETQLTAAANELARKCQVRGGHYIEAISEYEDVIRNSSAHADSVMAKVNIIELYMLMGTSKSNSKFTGAMSSLKPMNSSEGIRMVNELLFGIKSEVHNNVIPTAFSLSQNYPNPFNPMTKINYTLPVGTKISIKVYDLLGRLVKEVINEYKDAGAYSITFDGSSLASGIYIYKIEAGKFVESKKMVLLK